VQANDIIISQEVQKEKANVKEVQYFKMGEQKGVEKE